ncbi:MAG: AAA family ATPase [Deltaproteobacteria bacterium]|nr:AAA family ATPase [Deltaproteobacteria bacterium]
MGRVICIANQKGGVGKTTTAVNLAASVAITQRRTLIVDCDPQGNTTSGLMEGMDTPPRLNLYHCLCGGAVISEAVRPTAVPYLDILAADQNLVGAEIEMVSRENRERQLAILLSHVLPQYEYIFLDCPPALGLLTLNALVASDSILIPLQCEYFALEGLSALLKTIELVKSSLNPRLEIEGILLTMFDSRNALSHHVANDVRAHLPQHLFRVVIPRNVRLSECSSYGKPVILYDVKSRGAIAYIELAHEILSKYATKGVGNDQ